MSSLADLVQQKQIEILDLSIRKARAEAEKAEIERDQAKMVRDAIADRLRDGATPAGLQSRGAN